MNTTSQRRSVVPGLARRLAAHPALLHLYAGILATLVILMPVALLDGWPMNHESDAFVQRMDAVASRMGSGDLMPVWSSRLQAEHGSPLPGLYHKTFMVVSAVVLAVLDDPKAAILTTLSVFMLAAFLATAKAAEMAVGPRFARLGVLAGWLAIASNYATTDWLVRGAFAEFSALFVAALVLAWGIRLIRTGHWSLWLGPLMGLLLMSHSLVAVFAPVIVVAAMVVALPRRLALLPGWMLRGAASVALALATALPVLIPTLAYRNFNAANALVTSYDPVRNHIRLGRYFWDRDWRWGDTWTSFTVQFDLYALPLLAYVAAILASRLWWPPDAERRMQDRLILFLLACFLVFLFLQTKLAFPIYRSVPALGYLQFSWRLSLYMLLCLALLAVLVLARLWEASSVRWWRACVVALGLAMAAVSLNSHLWWSGLRYDLIPSAGLQAARDKDYWAGGEFLPVRPWTAGPPWTWRVELTEFLKTAPTGECGVRREDDPRAEPRKLDFGLDCGSAGTAILPVFLAPGMTISLRPAAGGKAVAARAYRTCEDPRARVDAGAGRFTAEVRFPTMLSLTASLFNGEAARRACP